MSFATIGSWIDRKLEGAQNSWRGSEAKKTIERVMERSQKAVTDTADRVSISAGQAKDNFKTNMEEIDRKNQDQGFFKKMMDVGKQGGFIGLAMKKPGEEKPAAPKQEAPKNIPEEVNGWNISG